MKNPSHQLPERRIASHRKTSSPYGLRSWRTILAIVLLSTVVHCYAQAVPGNQATLSVPVAIPILMDGKQIGSTKLPSGTKVSILKEEANRTLIKTAMGETWVENSHLQKPEPTVASQPEPAPATPSPNPQEVVASPVEVATATPTPAPAPEVTVAPIATPTRPNGKRAMFWRGWGKYEKIAKESLEKAGYTVDMIGDLPREQIEEKGKDYDVILISSDFFVGEGENEPPLDVIRNLVKADKELILPYTNRKFLKSILKGEDGKRPDGSSLQWGSLEEKSVVGKEKSVYFFQPPGTKIIEDSNGKKVGIPIPEKELERIRNFLRDELPK